MMGNICGMMPPDSNRSPHTQNPTTHLVKDEVLLRWQVPDGAAAAASEWVDISASGRSAAAAATAAKAARAGGYISAGPGEGVNKLRVDGGLHRTGRVLQDELHDLLPAAA